MTPDAVIEHVMAILGRCDSDAATLVVSHQPLVSALTALLVDGSTRQAFDYPMQPGSMAVIDIPFCEPGMARLELLISPPYDS